MFRKSRIAALWLASSALAASAFAQHVYPVQKQSAEQQKQDESRCLGWATQQSDFDPARPWLSPQRSAPATTAGSSASIPSGMATAMARGATHPDAGDAAIAGAIVAASSTPAIGVVDDRAKRRETVAAVAGVDGTSATQSIAASAKMSRDATMPTVARADGTPSTPAANAAAAAIVGRDAGNLAAGGAVAAATLRHDARQTGVMQQEQSVSPQQLAGNVSFEKARIECLEARGYTVQ